MDSDSFQIRYQPHADDQTMLGLGNEAQAIIQVGFALFIVIIAWLSFFFEFDSPEKGGENKFVQVFFFVAGLVVLGHGLYSYFKARKLNVFGRAFQRKVELVNQPLIEFSKSGLRLEDAISEEIIAWNDVLSVVETRHTLIINIDRERSLRIPRIDFKKDDQFPKLKNWMIAGSAQKLSFFES